MKEGSQILSRRTFIKGSLIVVGGIALGELHGLITQSSGNKRPTPLVEATPEATPDFVISDEKMRLLVEDAAEGDMLTLENPFIHYMVRVNRKFFSPAYFAVMAEVDKNSEIRNFGLLENPNCIYDALKDTDAIISTQIKKNDLYTVWQTDTRISQVEASVFVPKLGPVWPILTTHQIMVTSDSQAVDCPKEGSMFSGLAPKELAKTTGELIYKLITGFEEGLKGN